MVKKVKFLPVVAALALGLTAFASSNQTSAYTIQTTDANAVKICHTMTGIVDPVNTSFIYTVTRYSSDLNLSGVTATGGTISNPSTNGFTLTMPFSATSSTVMPICATVDLSGAMANNATWGAKTIVVEEAAGDADYPADDATRQINLVYELATDQDGNPIKQGSDYLANLSVKDYPTFETALQIAKTHITLEKKVRGNQADVNTQFSFNVTLTKKNAQSSAPNSYKIYNSTTNTTTNCTVGTACSVQAKHDDTVYIGYDNAASASNKDQLYVGAYEWTIEEGASSGYTTKYVTTIGGTTGAETAGTSYTKATLEEGDAILFINTKSGQITGRFIVIFPFIILAVGATIAIIAVRRTSKKEQA